MLSSVQLKTEEIGYRAADVLDGMMRGEKPERMLTLIEPLGMVNIRQYILQPIKIFRVLYIAFYIFNLRPGFFYWNRCFS